MVMKNMVTAMTDKRIFCTRLLILLLLVGTGWTGCLAQAADSNCPGQTKLNPVDKILEKLKQTTSELKSYEAQVEYLVTQHLFDDSRTLRKGVLHYAKYGKKSRLKVDFRTMQQDDEKQKKYSEQFIFDGVWLIHINGQIKHVKKVQLAEPNEPVDGFELVKRSFPIIGFTKVEQLKKDFVITLLDQDKNELALFTKLRLKVKSDSRYKDDYISIDFWIDNKTSLPARIVAVSTEEDESEIRLLKAKVNQQIDEKMFDYLVPAGYTSEVITLEDRRKQNVRGQPNKEN
jgi:outer membrane lipoprotein-sorting protein